MTHLFISHSSRDGAAIAQPLCAALESAGHSCWIAPRDVKPGVPYPGQIVSAIRDSAGLVLIVTPDANESPDVLQEVQLAAQHRKTVAPLIVSSTPPSDDLQYYLGVRHQIPWTDVRGAVEQLMRTFALKSAKDDRGLDNPATTTNAAQKREQQKPVQTTREAGKPQLDAADQAKATDVRVLNRKRIQDIVTVNDALQAYRAKNGYYPKAVGLFGVNERGPEWISGLTPMYLNELPKDPQGVLDTQYVYASDGRDYKLLAHGVNLVGSINVEVIGIKIDATRNPTQQNASFGFWTPGFASA